MRLLLDTHVFLWWFAGDVSIASLWEIAIKKNLGRVQEELADIEQAMAAERIEELPVRLSHAKGDRVARALVTAIRSTAC